MAEIKAELRIDNNSRRIRRNGAIPGVLYGGSGETVHLQIECSDPKPNVKHTLSYIGEGKKEIKEEVMVYSIQRYPIGDKILHIDFLRVNDDTEVMIPVTIKFTGHNKSKAIKTEGAKLVTAVARVKVKCALSKVPKVIEADISHLKVGQTLYAVNLELPAGVELAEKKVIALATMNKPRGGIKES